MSSGNDPIALSRQKLEFLKEALADLDDISKEKAWNTFMSWVTGVFSPVAASAGDVGMNVLKNSTGPGGRMLKEGYDQSKEIIEILQSDSLRDRLGNSAELLALEEGDGNLHALVNIVQAYKAFQSDKTGEAIGKTASALKKVLADSAAGTAIGNTQDGVNLGKALHTASENLKTISSDRDAFKEMLQHQKDQLNDRINAEEANLYKITAGQEGSTEGLQSSPNVFSRIDGLLARINVGIQRVRVNIGG